VVGYSPQMLEPLVQQQTVVVRVTDLVVEGLGFGIGTLDFQVQSLDTYHYQTSGCHIRKRLRRVEGACLIRQP